MAGTLLLQHVNSMTGGTTSVDLYGGTVQWKMGGWNTSTTERRGRVWETMDVVSTSSDANIRSEMANVDALFDYAKKYMSDPLAADPVWLYWQSESESVKRAVITTGETEILTDQKLSPLLNAGGMVGRLAMERMPYWEDQSGTTISLGTLSFDGGTVAIGNDDGTMNQRIKQFDFIPVEVVTSRSQIWAGIKPTRWGNSGFVPIWEIELGTTGTDTSGSADATASGGSVMSTTFATDATLVYRTLVKLTHVTASNFDHNVGKYMVVLRSKVSDSSTVAGIKITYGLHGGGFFNEQVIGYAYVDGSVTTSYKLYEVGEIQIPPLPDKDGSISQETALDEFFVEVYAERLAGTGTLQLDCFYMMPSEHLLTADKVLVGGGTGGTASYYTAPNDVQFGVARSTSGFISSDYNFHNWEYPKGGGLLMVLGQSSTHATLATEVEAEITLVPRWRTFRTT